jgi:hypothetical protein
MTNNEWDESLRRTEAHLDRELFLGRSAPSGALTFVRPDDYLETHTHVIGSSNFGKSYYIEHLLRECTEYGVPSSLIDPHGDLAQAYSRYLKGNMRLRRISGVIHLRPGDPSCSIGFDPFSCGLSEPGEIASLVLEACFKVWGVASGNETPRLERLLRLMFHAFAENARPLTESYEFLRVENHDYRRRLLDAVTDEKVRRSWQEIELLPKFDKLERFESSWNRLQRFLAIPAVEQLFTPHERNLNFADLFARRRTLIADLSLLHSTEAQSLVGAMLVNAMYHAAKRQARSRRRHWVLAIDEFPQFVTTDVARGLDELRKFGVRLILAHQHLGQLPPELLGSVLANAKFRIVFGGLPRRDAEILARELFTGEVRGDRTKYVNLQTKFRPHLVKREVETFSESETEGEGESDGWSRSSSSGYGDSSGEGRSERHYGDDFEESDETLSKHFDHSTSYSDTSGASGSRSRSRSQSSGRSQSTQYVTEHEEFREEGSRQFWSPEEEWERLTSEVMNLGRREALVKIFNGPVHKIITPDVVHHKRLRGSRRRHLKREDTAPGSSGRNGAAAPPRPEPPHDMPEDFRE